MASLSSGSSGSGALTQLVAQGALDNFLSVGASFTFFKVRYNKHTQFAMESCTQPFSTVVSFGSESQCTLNRQGDLIYYQYVCVDVPGITAVNLDENPGFGGGASFPTCTNACRPCKLQDDLVYEDYITEAEYDDPGTSEERKAEILRGAKALWKKDKFGAAAPVEACEDCVECPTDYDMTEFAYWTNNVGQHLVRRATIVIGGSPIDTLYSEYLMAWEELSGRSGRRLTEMVGKRASRHQLLCESREKRTLWIPLYFWYTMHSGQALALASLAFHGVRIDVEFASLKSCIVVSGPNVGVKNCTTASPIGQNDLTAVLESCYIYLDNAERDRFSTLSYEVLITQTQAYSVTATNSQVNLQLNFNHPVIELIWMVRRRCNENCNNWMNFSGIDSRDPVLSASLFLNNQSRFSVKPGVYFRSVVPYECHSNIPDAFIYCYSFALHPEDPSPSGSCNFSRIDHIELRLQLQEGLGREACSIITYARSWNILRFKDGLAGIAYAN